MSHPAPFLYRRLADTLAGQIRQGHFAPGERLPSVRSLIDIHGVSLSTAVQTYLWLEQEGWVEARPRAGRFVHARGDREPAMTRPRMVARNIAVADLALDVVKEARSPGVTNLGAAWADPRLPWRHLLRARGLPASPAAELRTGGWKGNAQSGAHAGSPGQPFGIEREVTSLLHRPSLPQ